MTNATDTTWDRGYVHVYTGAGKGKTTAALGLAFRAAGAGLRVFVGQLLKGPACCEHQALCRFADRIDVRRFGPGEFIVGTPSRSQRHAASAGLAACREVLVAGEHKVVILDEINVAANIQLLPVESVLDLIDARPKHVELVLTGRGADERVVQRADLVTEMRAVKHYFDAGVSARRGIEM
jgi:cob(I)alamin adenosyltransferase